MKSKAKPITNAGSCLLIIIAIDILAPRQIFF